MDNYEAKTYGDRIADVYDDLYTSYEEAAINTLTELAGGGRALELGIGTGRIAIPLAMKGIDVSGIDASEAMVAKLHAKSGGSNISVTTGSFADLNVEGDFSLIYVVFNTFFGLLTQEEQVLCFCNVAKHLKEDGCFLIEAFVPDMTRFTKGQNVNAIAVSSDGVNLEVTRHDAAGQRVNSQHIVITEYGIRLYPVQLRYAWPSELDLMAQIAGLRLSHRWSNWRRDPFTSESGKHISIYSRAI
jgi:SAM-dependent methyltransferase